MQLGLNNKYSRKCTEKEKKRKLVSDPDSVLIEEILSLWTLVSTSV
jgi:hypothetical protein